MNGAVIFEGPSRLDGAPIVVIVTGLASKSRNEKTGDMLQTWILRADVHPQEALKSGEDASICGGCKHRPALGGACYVQVARAPSQVWKAYKAGRYPKVKLDRLPDLAAHRMVRLGSYGDPAAVPPIYWRQLTLKAEGWTGYTHQWASAPALKSLCMASVDSPAEYEAARAKGWRTFRVRTAAAPLMGPREIMCPASEEAGKKTDCASCKACMGTMAKARVNIAIVAHGARARKFEEA